MRVSDYSEAAYGLVQSGMTIDTVLSGLSRVLTERGHARLYPKILRDLAHLAEKHQKNHGARVTVATQEDRELLKSHIDAALATLNVAETETIIDPTISGGYIVSQTERRIDASYKKKLLTLYRTLIK